MDEQLITRVVTQVMQTLAQDQHTLQGSNNSFGIYETVSQCVEAASVAKIKLAGLSLNRRREIIQVIRDTAISQAQVLAEMAAAETGLGRATDKVAKNKFAAQLTPGVEDILAEGWRGGDGHAFVEREPFGVIASYTPVTHPTATIVNHAIAMISGGNTVVFSPHPKGVNCGKETVKCLNRAIIEADGPADLMVMVDGVTLEKAQELMHHKDINLVVATGGPALARAALDSGKKAIVAGPGNPPALVDETADLANAATSIIAGSYFENNILCIAEKSIFVVNSVADLLIKEMQQRGACYLNGPEADKVTDLLFKNGSINPDYIGKDATLILADCGMSKGDVKIVILNASPKHPLVVHEQMLPVLPFVRVDSFAEGLRLAKETEGGHEHTCIIHSRNYQRIQEYLSAIAATVGVANVPSYAALGVGGEGIYGHTITGATGEGICTAKTFTRCRYTVIGA